MSSANIEQSITVDQRQVCDDKGNPDPNPEKPLLRLVIDGLHLEAYNVADSRKIDGERAVLRAHPAPHVYKNLETLADLGQAID
jgi:hypothetical protein